MAAGAFETIEQAQDALCPRYRTVEPDAAENAACERLYGWYRKIYFAMGRPDAAPAPVGDVLPGLRKLAAQVRRMAAAG
jgi:L-ribulokinase